MLKIERSTERNVVAVDYKSIPEGAVFTYIDDAVDSHEDGVLYLKCQQGYSVMLNSSPGRVEEDEDFIQDERIWVIVDATLVIKQ
jgi:hypothetical protein